MLPPMLTEAADTGAWKVLLDRTARDGSDWFTLSQPDTGMMIDVRRDRWRHTTARAFRGSALSAILTGQRAIAEYLEAT